MRMLTLMTLQMTCGPAHPCHLQRPALPGGAWSARPCQHLSCSLQPRPMLPKQRQQAAMGLRLMSWLQELMAVMMT